MKALAISLLILGTPIQKNGWLPYQTSGLQPDVQHISTVSAGGSGLTSGYALLYPNQRKAWYAAGLHWFFYGNGSGTTGDVYRTSVDGITWSSETQWHTAAADDGGLGHRFSTWFDGTHFHYAYGNTVQGDTITYRMGTLNGDGTITWAAAEQNVYTNAAYTSTYPTISVDATGHPWIGFTAFTGGFGTAPMLAFAVRSTTTNGTWTTDASTPQLLATTATQFPTPMCAVMDSGENCYYNLDNGNPLKYQIWTGGVWTGPFSASTSNNQYNAFTILQDGTYNHVIIRNDVAHTNSYRRLQHTTWGAETLIFTAPNAIAGITSCGLLGSSDVLCLTYDYGTNNLYTEEIANNVLIRSRLVVNDDNETIQATGYSQTEYGPSSTLDLFYVTYGQYIGIVINNYALHTLIYTSKP